jgi:hypothetical protein
MSMSKRFMVFVPLVSVFYRAGSVGYGARTSKEAIAKGTDSRERSPARPGPQGNRPPRNGFMRAAVTLAALTAVALVAAAITPVHAQTGNGRCENIQKNAAADRVEKIYTGFVIGTDAAETDGYLAAQKAEEQLRLDFLSSFQNPQRNAANQTAWDQEEAQLISDSLKYGGDRTLDAAALYWARLTCLCQWVARKNCSPRQRPGRSQTNRGKEIMMSIWPVIWRLAFNRLTGWLPIIILRPMISRGGTCRSVWQHCAPGCA